MSVLVNSTVELSSDSAADEADAIELHSIAIAGGSSGSTTGSSTGSSGHSTGKGGSKGGSKGKSGKNKNKGVVVTKGYELTSKREGTAL